MTTEKVVGSYCRGCQGVFSLGRKDCPCQTMLPFKESEKFRASYWYPAYIRVSVTMASAQQ